MPSLFADFKEMIELIADRMTLPAVSSLYLPPPEAAGTKNGEFGVLTLEDGSVGLVYLLLSDTFEAMRPIAESRELVGINPARLVHHVEQHEGVEKALAMGAVNAISQSLLRRSGYPLDFSTDTVDELIAAGTGAVGMVGYFPPLVEKLRSGGIPLTVLELKPELVTREGSFEVSLNPESLNQCDRVICTATTLLNSSLESVLSFCHQAPEIALIGPTAGFLPDPVFNRGVTLVGGSQIPDVAPFIVRCEKGEKWGESAAKYTLKKSTYPGYKRLLEMAEKKGG